MKKNIQLIIPMSGMGKRFVNAGYDVPKPLINVDGKPIIQHVVELFPGIASENIVFICNTKHLKETSMKEVLKNLYPSSEILEIDYSNSKGPVDAVLKTMSALSDSAEIIVSYCDYGTVWDFNEFLDYVHSRNCDGAMPCYTGFHPHMLGTDNYAFCKQENMELVEIKEKEPFTEDRMSEYASNGTYYFKNKKIIEKYFQKLIDLNINVKDEYYVSLVYNLLVKDGLKVGIFEIDKMLQWGTPYDLEIYKQWLQYFKDITQKQNTAAVCPKDTSLILPMAGRGSRFSEVGYELPKPLLPVNAHPMVIEAVECLPKCEENYFGVLQEHVDDFNIQDVLTDWNSNSYVIPINKTTEGQACTCEIIINNSNIDLEKPILISACDNGLYCDQEYLQQLFDDTSVDVIVWSFRNHQTSKLNPDMYAWLKVDADDLIQHVSCKKFIYKDPLNTHAIIGTMFFRKAKYFIDGLRQNYSLNIRTNNEFYVDDVLNRNIENGLKVKVFEVKNYICWGTPDDYKTYNYWKEHFQKDIK